MTNPTPPVTAQDHSRGKPNARVLLLEYADYQCPHSGAAHAVLAEVLPQFDAAVTFVFRNFPLPDLHPRSVEAAEAAEAAGAQGKFWEMHDHLFEHQDQLGDPDLARHAAELGLDGERFARELAQHTHLPRIATEVAGGVRSGVPGTPTFFINGLHYEGSWEAEVLRDVLAQTVADSTAV